MKIPPKFQVSSSKMVCHLHKSLYGLKQARRCCFAKLSTTLKGYGFQQSHSDYFLFTLQHNHIQLNLLVYMDNLII